MISLSETLHVDMQEQTGYMFGPFCLFFAAVPCLALANYADELPPLQLFFL